MSMRLSKSKINTFIDCPLKFKYQNIDKLESKPNDAFTIGTNVHQIAEDFIKSGNIENKDIIASLLELEKDYEDDYTDHCQNLAKFFKCMFIDKKYKFFMAEDYLFSEKHNFSGLADLVLEDSEGKLFVIDYKTGKSSNVKNYKLELCYYKMLIEEKYPEKEVKYAGIFFTKDGKLSYLEFGGEICPIKDYELAINFIDTVRVEIEAERFPPRRHNFCRFCDYKEQCKIDSGF